MEVVSLKNDRDRIITIQQFELMSDYEQDKFKGCLVCEECGAVAKYRRKSRDGKSACFFATHFKGCCLSNSNNSSNEKGEDKVETIEKIAEYNIVWNYNKYSKEEKIDKDKLNEKIKINKNIKQYINVSDKVKRSSISLSTILKCAIYDVLEEQSYDIYIPGYKKVKLKEYVMSIEDVSAEDIGKECFIYGEISRFNEVWLSTKYKNKISICLDNSIQKEFWDIYKEKMMKFIKNKKCMFILWGKIDVSKKGNIYIKLFDKKQFYMNGRDISRNMLK